MPSLVIHGGAGRIRAEDHGAYRAGLRRALAAGWEALLAEGAHAAALAAVASMEADPAAFNAGVGGAPTRDGRVECDAAVMRSDGTSGAVACLTRARTPVRVAERVRAASPHALLVGAGADALVDDPVDNAELLTERSRAALARWRERAAAPEGSATVGAVAVDDDGRLCAATSTGGVLGQWPGRVGDCPVIGAGTYCSRVAAISCTGAGEAFLRAVTAKGLEHRLAAGEAPAAALPAALAEVAAHGGDGGIIVVTAGGRLAWSFTTPHMAVGWRTPDGAGAEVEARPRTAVR